MSRWMVRVWFNAYDDEHFIDEMPTQEYLFETKEEAIAFKKAFNEKFWNHGGWEPYMVDGHRYGSNYVAGSPAEGPYEQVLPDTFTVEEAIAESYGEAECWGMEEEE